MRGSLEHFMDLNFKNVNRRPCCPTLSCLNRTGPFEVSLTAAEIKMNTGEIDLYQLWHRSRFLGVKPGITGLWQVKGRSRTTFDDMVRLDLEYVKHWSLWLDVKILLHTPRAVLSREGAY